MIRPSNNLVGVAGVPPEQIGVRALVLHGDVLVRDDSTATTLVVEDRVAGLFCAISCSDPPTPSAELVVVVDVLVGASDTLDDDPLAVLVPVSVRDAVVTTRVAHTVVLVVILVVLGHGDKPLVPVVDLLELVVDVVGSGLMVTDGVGPDHDGVEVPVVIIVDASRLVFALVDLSDGASGSINHPLSELLECDFDSIEWIELGVVRDIGDGLHYHAETGLEQHVSSF